jgi:hypothetical protein
MNIIILTFNSPMLFYYKLIYEMHAKLEAKLGDIIDAVLEAKVE